MKCMMNRSQLVSFLLAAILAGCTSSPTEHRHTSTDAPAIVIRQYPDYPMPGRASEFPGGLVAALWRDGRLIRPARPDALGKSYVEGMVEPKKLPEFFSFLSAAVVQAPKIEGIPLHVATQSITVRSGGTAQWTRILPDTVSIWREVESRLHALPLQDSRTVDEAAVRSSRWYD
jgi:hypothetical protein